MMLRRLLLLLLAWPAAAGAQRVTGTVRDSASRTVVAGAVVSVLDSAQHVTGRGLTDAAGRYSLELPASARALRIVRIGFRPRVVPMAGLSTPSPFDVAMERLTTLLSAVEVNDAKVCSNDDARTAALALWEQARAGLLGAIVAREANPAYTSVINYERNVDYESGRVATQKATRASGRTTRPFSAAKSASSFADHGYSETLGGTTTFFAPDADVLLDDSFAATHCFSVAPADAQHPGAVGLAFEPVRGRDMMVDVRGVLWMDAGLPALRSIEYRYTGPDVVLNSREGFGIIHFTTVSNGVTFIDEWMSRLPVYSDRAIPDRNTVGARRPSTTTTVRRVDQLGETGGVVEKATWPDGTKWELTLAPLTGVVTEEHSTRPLAGVLVVIPATGDSVSTDSLGRFSIYPLFPGKYQVALHDTALSAFVRPRRQQLVATIVREGMNSLRPKFPSRVDAIRRLCDDTTNLDRTSILLGQVIRPAGTGKAPEFMVQTSWVRANATLLTRDETIFGFDKMGLHIDEDGRFSTCGVPREVAAHLKLTRDRVGYADTTITIPYNRQIQQLVWRLPPDAPAPPPAAARP